MRIVFMGTPDYATEILKALIAYEGCEVVALYCQPDKPVGRKQVLTPPHTKQYLLDNQINMPVKQPETLRDESIIEEINCLQPDIMIVAAYGQILPKAVLELCPCVNLHASLLPQYRGASPIQESILHGDSITGVTAMKMDVGLDTGDILGFACLPIDATTKVEALFHALSLLAAKLSVKILAHWDALKAYPQNSADASLCKKIKKEYGQISFEMSADEIDRKFRAYNPWPGVFLESGLKIKDLVLVETDEKNVPGKVLSIENDSVMVGCSRGSVRISTLQPPSKKAMDAQSYMRGQRMDVGDILV